MTIDGLARDAVLRCLVIRGRGQTSAPAPDFWRPLGRTAQQLADQRALILSVFDRLDAFPVPVIAAFHGEVVAGGVELALACDIRVSTTTSRWARAEVLP
ncbi:MAG TPA: enoyl-CoA hydratase-related protein, partial [Streptosporangiaceae bacterium]|nr:enoyl-CoA hydratase-related protein [Streptosporangiaceae bacterium]